MESAGMPFYISLRSDWVSILLCFAMVQWQEFSGTIFTLSEAAIFKTILLLHTQRTIGDTGIDIGCLLGIYLRRNREVTTE